MTEPAQQAEIRLQGIGVSPGIAWGPAEILGKALEEPEKTSIQRSEVDAEKARISLAMVATRDQIVELQRQIASDDGEDHASIFDAHLLLLEDSSVLNEVLRLCEAKLISIECAYFSVMKRYVDSLRKIADPYLRERAVDIEDVAGRVLKNLKWTEPSAGSEISESNATVILAHDLTPSDTVGLDRSKVKGFATEVGSATSHTAIMARSLGIPAVVALHDIPEECERSENVLIDGYHGLVIVNPSPETLVDYEKLLEEERGILSDLEFFKGKPTITSDGNRITLSANIEFLDELKAVAERGAEGVGLYRTEFFYMSEKELRTEENQAQNYRTVAEATSSDGVIIRTLDIGGDKLYPELRDDPEPNPFLGWRGIRLSLDRAEEFRVQLRAILRASAHGKVRVMFPFISSLQEIQAAKEQIEISKQELREADIPFDEKIEVGAMIEIPSAVLVADHLAQEVDFFSIGTNDLIQYTTAVDRINDRVANLYQPMHPAVIGMIRETVEAAHRNDIWCGVCGEAAGDLVMTPIWVGLGVDELSVGSVQLLKTRKAISLLSSKECSELMTNLQHCGTEEMVKRRCLEIARSAYPELLY
ncbi:MAG: phosphoenolpyruvate--protein phosphotransferase [Verrucomicrobiales bacterium]|nr:phosphoenolpyruvate--protein phosphotransferase [Verrucomicrobiales bacterium]|tara:strand:- start:11240 stop:13012 length:1773 start_codon:yes stop_codon:yes gene_type:complete